MKKEVSLWQEFFKGIWEINPSFKQILGTCPTFAVTVSVINGIAVALATTFVLVFSSMLISLVKKLIPNQVRIAAYIVIIATFVTVADLVMKAQFPELSKALGPFVPLIVVNCIILGRAEAFASKNNVIRSVLDALGNGAGFLLALILMGSIRELLGSRSLLDYQILPDSVNPLIVMILPAGAFFTYAILIASSNAYINRKKRIEHEKTLKKFTEASKTFVNSEA